MLALMVTLGTLGTLVQRVFGDETFDGVSLFYAVVPFAQILLLFGMLGFRQYLLPEVDRLYLCNCAMVLVFVVGDAGLFWSLSRSRDHALSHQRATLLAQELNATLEAYETTAARLARTARLRHDFRNQAQVVLALAAEGRTQEARARVAELQHLLRATEKNTVAELNRPQEEDC